jgi:RNA polymerase sigma-70 factor (ECF subfamily)
MTDRSDVELMLASKGGDERAFAVLVDRHRAAIMNLTYRYLGNRADAEDLAQEVFLRVHRARHGYRPEAKFTTWLYRIAVNACLNEVRNRKSRPTFGAASLDDSPGPAATDARAPTPADATERAELLEQVREAVAALPERQRLALLMNKFHGLGYEELATSLEMTVPAVKSLLVRARENVRRRIEPYLDSGGERIAPKRGTA